MAGLQRSAVSVRRQGSSGYVWDDKFLGELFQAVNQKQEQPQRNNQENSSIEVNPVRTVDTIKRSRSNGGGQQGYRVERVSPAIAPPSPKVSACGFCGAFGNRDKGHPKKAGKGRSR